MSDSFSNEAGKVKAKEEGNCSARRRRPERGPALAFLLELLKVGVLE